MSEEESDPGENGAEYVDGSLDDRTDQILTETDMDMQDRLGAVAPNVAVHEIDEPDPPRATMAHLFEVICTEEDDVIRDELSAHKHLLNREIIISVNAYCVCSLEFETFPIIYGGDGYQETTGMIKEMILNGACKCEPSGERSSSGRSLLEIAAGLGKVWLVDFLVDQGCEIDIYTPCFDKSPLLVGIIHKSTEVVQTLVDRGADLNHCTSSGIVPLIESVRYAGSHESADNTILKILLDSGRCNLNVTSGTRETALEMAILNRNTEAVELLLEMKADPNIVDSEGESPLYLGTVEPQPAIVTALIESGADVNAMNGEPGETALQAAVYSGYTAIVSILLSNGADANKPTRDGYPPIVLAVDGMYPEILDILINKGAAVDTPSPNNFTALHNAAWEGYKECIDILLAHGASPDALTQCKNTPLALAAHGNHLETLTRLLLEDVNVNNADKDLDTPLHYAAYNGCVESVKLLLERGANPNVINRFKASPLWNAVYMKHFDVVRALILSNVTLEICSQGNDQVRYNGVDVLPLYYTEQSVLWVAVERRCSNIVDLLVEAGYNLWKEEWLLQNNQDGLPEESLPIFHRLQTLVQQAPSLMFSCRNFLRGYSSSFKLKHLVQTSPLPGTLKDFLLLKDIGK